MNSVSPPKEVDALDLPLRATADIQIQDTLLHPLRRDAGDLERFESVFRAGGTLK